MANIKISDLPAGIADANDVVPVDNFDSTVTHKVTLGDIRDLPHTHNHGDVINSVSTLPQLTASPSVGTGYVLGSGNIIRLSSSVSVDIASIAAGNNGDIKILTNVGQYDIVFLHDEAQAGINILCPSNVDFTLTANSSCHIYYDSASLCWRIW